ncbi:hypothetical protein CDAR_24261 [Caerostris darwini]|uniref:Uncharacterized protein n=1 Tax=Caerostris darwini TaxID=1538125 RepID=A0AAV4QHD9_9ARAC|nr:hypothetical protein CDAR_24261 [Caerostris darwini]
MRESFCKISIRNGYYIPAPSSRSGQYEASRHCPCEVDALSHQLLKVFIRKCSRASTSLTRISLDIGKETRMKLLEHISYILFMARKTKLFVSTSVNELGVWLFSAIVG